MTRLERILLIVALVLLVVSGLVGKWAGHQAAAVHDAKAALVTAHDATTDALREAARLDTLSKSLLKKVTLAESRQRLAVARTDSVRATTASARDSALSVARDSGATLQETRAQVEALAAASLRADSAFMAERQASLARIATLDTALAGALGSGVGKDGAILALQREVTAARNVIRALEREKPGLLRRAYKGVATAGSAAACGAIALSFTGPIGAIGAGAGCAALAGVLIP
jgi:hypothetical protein